MLIVVAEDEFLIACMLVAGLEDAGHVVRSAANGIRALHLIRADLPDLVITDFMMPQMTGLELAETIKADPVLAAIPIVLVSGAQGRIARSRTDLFDHVLDKPYALERLIDVAEALCGGASAEPTMLSAGPRPLV